MNESISLRYNLATLAMVGLAVLFTVVLGVDGAKIREIFSRDYVAHTLRAHGLGWVDHDRN